MRRGDAQASGRLLDLRFRRSRRLVEARGGAGHTGAGTSRAGAAGAGASGRGIVKHRHGTDIFGGFSSPHRARAPLAPMRLGFGGRLGSRRFGRIREHRMEGTFGGFPSPIVHVIGRRRRDFGGSRHQLRGDGRDSGMEQGSELRFPALRVLGPLGLRAARGAT